jgi:hypothetical protein
MEEPLKATGTLPMDKKKFGVPRGQKLKASLNILRKLLGEPKNFNGEGAIQNAHWNPEQHRISVVGKQSDDYQ